MFAPCAVIPVYNHEHAIAAVVMRVRAQRLPIVLVDDGCNEVCGAELQRLSREPDVTLVRHASNRGKGAAVCTGLRAAKELGFTHALVPSDPGKVPPGMKVLEVADMGDALRVLPRSRRREAPRDDEDRR